MNQKNSYDIGKVLREMREEYWRGIEEVGESVAETADYLVFGLDGERFGLPTKVIREVLRLPKMVRVPRVPESIRGVINLRGQIVAVTDLRPLLGLAGRETPASARLVVVEAAGVTTALLAEQVEGIRSLPTAAVEPLTSGLTGFPREVALGQVAESGGFLILLDLDCILSRPELIVDQQGE
ncbi:MAG: chemotaxis protein CheW [Desulfuromonadales bacterium]|jgi:purine-binding chemotaxis protein CheW